MSFVFSRLFYVLLALGFVPLSLAWAWPALKWAALAYDLALVAAALLDARLSRWPDGLSVERKFDGRFYIGGETEVRVEVGNNSPRRLRLRVKDEYPPQMKINSPREAEMLRPARRSSTARPPRAAAASSSAAWPCATSRAGVSCGARTSAGAPSPSRSTR